MRNIGKHQTTARQRSSSPTPTEKTCKTTKTRYKKDKKQPKAPKKAKSKHTAQPPQPTPPITVIIEKKRLVDRIEKVYWSRKKA